MLECLVSNQVPGVVPGCEELSHLVGLYEKVFIVRAVYVGGGIRIRDMHILQT